jgi:DNA-binding MurR/RpiR family transcriptional regulator
MTTPLVSEIEGLIPRLPLAEQRMATFFIRNRQATVLGSAAQIAADAGMSDATVVRTARSLGYSSLAELREALLTDLVSSPPPADRLRRTLAAASDAPGGTLAHVLDNHRETLAVLEAPEFAAAFQRSLAFLAKARHCHVFGVGPSGAMADYAALQFNRIGRRSTSLNATGIALADRLLALQFGDVVLLIAYAPLYREVKVTLDRAHAVGASVILVSDSLGPLLDVPVAESLPVPRGKAGHLAMHGATTVVIDAMIAGLAALDGSAAVASLVEFAELRSALDKTWARRGARRAGGIKPPGVQALKQRKSK